MRRNQNRRLMFAFALTILWGMTACQQQKQLDEMHDSTVEMNKTTKELRDTTVEMKQKTEKLQENTGEMKTVTTGMSDKITEMGQTTKEMAGTTKEMQATTQELNQVTGELYDASRQGAALEIRRKSLEMLYSAESNGKKIAEAGKYFMSFEFQLWTGFGQDETAEKRDQLLTDAASEFFKDLKEFTVEKAPWFNPFAKPNGKGNIHDRVNKEASFNAIAAAMHRVNRKQEEMHAKNPNVKVLSMYDVILESLRLEKDLNEGRMNSASLKGYQREVLNNKDVAINLLQARHNFIGTIFLNEVLPQEGVGASVRNGLNYYLHFGKKWTLDLTQSKYNLPKLQQLAQYLMGLLNTRQALRDLGVEPQVDSTLAAFIAGLTLPKASWTLEGELGAARFQVTAQIIELKKNAAP